MLKQDRKQDGCLTGMAWVKEIQRKERTQRVALVAISNSYPGLGGGLFG